ITGVFLGAVVLDYEFRGTYWVVAHFHYVMVGGATGLFAGIYYWFPKMFGRMMSEAVGKVHFALTFVFFNLTFFPMHEVGLEGMMRRIYETGNYQHLSGLQGTNEFISWSALGLLAVGLLFAGNFIYGMFWGEEAEANPWDANTLEWQTPSPAKHGNWETLPTVYHGPYEYSHPEVADKDWLAQNERPEVTTPYEGGEEAAGSAGAAPAGAG
ncbi:MAG: cbb3-type cytochrome c oxidase subunit I, partial [Gemmatimonadota bacterium]